MSLAKNSNRTRRGIAIAEALVYIAILSIMTVAIINGLIFLVGTYKSFKSAKDLSDAAAASLDRLQNDIRLSESVNLAQSSFGTDPGTISLNQTVNDASVAVSFYASGGTLYVAKDGVPVGSLTGSSTRVTSLVFHRIATPVSEGVKVDLSLQSGSGGSLKNAAFSATDMLRGSYLNQ